MGVEEPYGPPEFEDWYRREHPRLLGLLVAATGSVDIAADATDEAFARALARWKRVSTMASPAGWTYRVALNLVRRHHKHRGREQAIPVPRDATSFPTSDPAVWEAVRNLPTRQREAVLLRYVADFSEADIAAVMSVRRGTVASTLAAARQTLSEQLVEDLQEEAL
jgi:RNA polymerase sigma-70 factor, ECF subfamily